MSSLGSECVNVGVDKSITSPDAIIKDSEEELVISEHAAEKQILQSKNSATREPPKVETTNGKDSKALDSKKTLFPDEVPTETISSMEHLHEMATGLEEKTKTLFSEDRLFMAFKALHDLEHKLKEIRDNDCHAEDIQSSASQRLDELQVKDFVVRLRKRMQQAEQLVSELKDETGWTLYQDDASGRTWYRDESNGQQSFRVAKVVSQPLLKVVAVLGEIDLYSEWFPFMHSAREIASPSRFHKFCEMRVNLPWPLYPRVLVLDCFGADVVEDDSIIAHIASIEEHPTIELPALSDDVVRMTIPFGGFYLTVIDADHTNVIGIFNIEIGMDFIPAWVNNAIMGQLVHWIVHNLEKAANFDPEQSTYSQRIAANPILYEFAKEICERIHERVQGETVTQLQGPDDE